MKLLGAMRCAYRTLRVLISANGAATLAPLRLDIIEIDLDAAQFYQTWRLAIAHATEARQALLRVVPSGAR